MEVGDLTIGMVGAGGDGVAAAGDILINAAASMGLHGIMLKSFGPQIRGGESSFRLQVSTNKIHTPGTGLDVLACFSWSDYGRFSGELDVKNDVIILMDSEDETPEDKLPIEGGRSKTIVRVPFTKLSKEIKNPKGKNMVSLGVLAVLFNFPEDGIISAIQKKFRNKKDEIARLNIETFELGRKYVSENISGTFPELKYKKGEPRLLLTGDEAVAFGALVAGCRFYASYPITPASEIMEWLSVELPKFGGTVVQAEDEISAICMVTGATYGGVKSMTATSGPGLSLKLEALGLGSIAELPYVVVDVQRGGPSTGLPTKPEQADLGQAVWGMHGDAPHAVIAAADVEDCFRAAVEAFNIAEVYQMPVILLLDQYLGHRKETVRELNFEEIKIFDRLKPHTLSAGGYKRFVDTPDGISPMTWPGMKCGEYLCSGIEHDEWGAPSAMHTTHEIMSRKREKKIDRLEKEFKFIRRYGENNPKVGVIAWGSNKGVVRAAIDYFEKKGESVGGLVPQLIYPLQKDIFKEFLDGIEALVIVENSFSGQFHHYLRSRLDLPKKVYHLKASGGKYFTIRDVIGEIDRALSEVKE